MMDLELLNAAESAYDKLKILCLQKDWQLVGEYKGVEMSKRRFQDSTISMYKGVKVIDNNPKLISELFLNLDPTTLKKWDPTFEIYQTERSVEKQADFQLDIDYMVSSLPWPVWSRDFVLLSARKIVGNAIYHFQTSIDYPHKPPQPDKYVRGLVNVSGFVFEPVGTESIESSKQTKITRILHVDPKGQIPSWIINSESNKQIVDLVNNIATLGIQSH